VARILVTDGDERAALASVRSLGRAGHQVMVASTSGRSLAGASRSCDREVRLPDPLITPGGFIGELSELIREVGTEILLPITEATLLAVLPARDTLHPARIPFPPDQTFRDVADKGLVLARARDLGIPTPTLARVDDPDELSDRVSALSHPYPLVLKPLRSVACGPSGQIRTGVQHVADSSQLELAAASMERVSFPVLVQRRIEGPGIGIFLLMHEGRAVAAFGHRRLREKPPSGGVSVLRESAAIPEPLLRASEELLRSFRWEGVAMVEYKVDDASGEVHLMEINGRLWGSLQLAIDAGVDFPVLLADLALGKPLPGDRSYEVGVRTRWLMGDVDHLLARLRRSREALSLGPDAPGRGQVLLDFARAFFPPHRNEIFRWTDPAPQVRELLLWVRALRG
jgi:predicted ATP-grasp superfamily ATP-dependent carboligase